MFKKLYMIYNVRTEKLTGEIFHCYNDREAEYNFSIYIDSQKEKNKYFMEKDFKLACLGVIHFDKDNQNKLIGIKVDENQYPIIFDEIKDGWKPTDEQNYNEDISSNEINFEKMQREYNKDVKEMKGVK